MITAAHCFKAHDTPTHSNNNKTKGTVTGNLTASISFFIQTKEKANNISGFEKAPCVHKMSKIAAAG